MENNSLIMGRIPCGGGGFCKTYEESIFYDKYEIREAINNKAYLSKSGQPYFGERKSMEDRELIIIRIYPYGDSGRYFLLELIDKDILHAHLEDEREIIERLIDSGQNTLTLK